MGKRRTEINNAMADNLKFLKKDLEQFIEKVEQNEQIKRGKEPAGEIRIELPGETLTFELETLEELKELLKLNREK